MQKENQLKSYYKNNLSSREVVARDLPHPMPLSLLNRKQQPYFMQEVEDPGLQIAGMTPLFYNGNKGFTLIELLVVVLIIGILAAVALPQYQTAVNKSRFSNLRTTAESLLKAAQSYTAATNEWPDNFDVLAVDLPGGFTQKKVGTFTCGKNTTMYCCMITGGGWSPAVTCGKKDYTFAFYSKYTTDLVIDAPMNNFCVAKESDANAKQLCKSLTKREGVLMGWGLVTPENTNLGGATGYRWYTL